MGPQLLCLLIMILQPALVRSNTEVSEQIFTLFRSFIDSDVIVRSYERDTVRHEIDTDKLGEYVGKVTGAEFNDAFLALTNIKNTAQSSYEKHTWDKSMRYDYWDGFTHPLKSTNGSNLPLQHSDRYQAHVSLTESAINLPLDVYDNWTEVRNTIQWTEGLDKAFVDNHAKKADNIFWQYIGTPEGVMRTFPATYIPAKDQVDFDVRRRPWYNAGIGCPKDVILLIDTSGSLEGFPSRLLKTTAKKLIQLILADTDFVTAIGVGYKAKYLTCYNHLTRANKAVKRTIIDAISDIKPNGTSNWQEGFEMAFRTFNASAQINQTTFCERAIVLFSDETGQRVDEIVKALNYKRQVRVYVFSFRKNEGLYSDRLKTLACSNRGYYSKILYFGQIESALQRLVQIGNSPLMGKDVLPTWSNAYKDLGGFGLVITVTMPVVVGTSKSEKIATNLHSNNSVSLLGIVGLDFKSSRIVQIASSILPLSSTSIIVNNKGYPVYHPRIDKYMYEDVNTKLHNFQFTDENKADLIKLETNMIDKVRTKVPTKGFLNFEWQRRGSEWYQDMVYQIFPVVNTPFSIACIYSNYPPSYLMYKLATLNIEDIDKILEGWTSKGGKKLYLDNFQDNSCALLKEMEKRRGVFNLDSDDICNSVIFSIFTDIYLSRDWEESVFLYPSSGDELISHFIMTYTGMVFFSNHRWISSNLSSMATLTPYAQTTKNITSASLFISIPFRRENYNFKSVNVTQRVKVSVDGIMTQVAAVGVEVRLELLRQRVLGIYNDKYERFLVDENGIILMGYPTNVQGYLGVKYPMLMKALIRHNIYHVLNYTECINLCTEPVHADHHGSSALSNFKPILYNFLSSLINLLANLKLFFYLDYLADSVEGNHVIKEQTVECCMMYNLFQRNFDFNSSKHYIDDVRECYSMYEVSAVPHTNLILVVDHRPHCKLYDEAMRPDEGVRVLRNQACNQEYRAHLGHSNDRGDHDGGGVNIKSVTNHYYKPFKTCIIDNDDEEGTCSRSISLLSSYLVIYSTFSWLLL